MRGDRAAPEVSFILPSYNREPVLRECLAHLYEAPQDFPFETIVMDNGSSDGSAAMVRREFPRARLNALGENLGAGSRNLAMKEARGRYIVMLDDDSYPAGRSVATALEVLRRDRAKRIGAIAFNIRRADGSHETAGIFTAFTGCGAMFHRDVLERSGGYPEDYLFYVEEYDVSCRLHDAGLEVLNFRELEVVHLKTGVRRDFDEIMARLVRNNVLLWTRYLPRDLAEPQVEMELWRYERIARKEGALAGYERGVAAGREAAAPYLSDRSLEIGRGAAERALGLDAVRRAAERIAEAARGKRILVFNIGKTLHLVLEEVRARGLEVTGIVDDNLFMQRDGFRGIPVFPRSRLLEGGYGGILIGSASLSLNDRFERELNVSGLGVPLVRLCEYDRLEDWLPREVREPEGALARASW